MKFRENAWKLGVGLVIFGFFAFVGPIFLFGYWAGFKFDIPKVNVILGSQEDSNTNFIISYTTPFDVDDLEGETPYKISPWPDCDNYDDNGNCLSPIMDLCPYISLDPKDGESKEIGFAKNSYYKEATGELALSADKADNWNLSIKSPCFEGECPADYDSEMNGAPLPQSLKGQTFTCHLEVSSSEAPPLVLNFFKNNFAFADDFVNTLDVSAVLTGETAGCTTDCFSNVLFLPGIEASRLYKQRALVGEDQLWEPNTSSDVDYLYLNTDGTSKNSGIYTRDIIDKGLGIKNIYKSFSDTMDQLVVNQKIKDWKSFAYDWRQSVDDIANNGTKYKDGTLSLMDTLQSLAGPASKNGKVTIIAHSNGGLLAKALLKKLQDDKTAGLNNLIDNVDVLIMVAVPEIGTAKAVPAILHGYGQSMLGGWLIDEENARELGRNMLGAYGLLPSKEYINQVSASPTTFKNSELSKNLFQTFGSAIDSYSEYKSFLFGGEGRTNPLSSLINLPISLSSTLFSKAENLHNSIDAWTPPASMRVMEVAGWGKETLASFEYDTKQITCPEVGFSCNPNNTILDEVPRFTVDGDGTVVVPSAQYMSSSNKAQKYWVNLTTTSNDHSNILELSPVLNFISSTIENSTFNSTYITNTAPVDTLNRFRISIHSPVSLDAYDSNGNHTGKICPPNSDFCYLEENIPNSSYLEFGEGKYLNLPENKAKSIKLQGTDVGTFTYDSEKVFPNGTSTISSFVDIPVTTQTQAEIVLNPTTQIPQLKLDVTGDGVTDFTLAPTATFDSITYLSIMKATVDSLDILPARIKAFDTRVDNIIKAIQKGKVDKAKLKADRFKAVLEKKLAKPDPKHPKPKKLSKTDAQLLLDMLNQLLDNIG